MNSVKILHAVRSAITAIAELLVLRQAIRRALVILRSVFHWLDPIEIFLIFILKYIRLSIVLLMASLIFIFIGTRELHGENFLSSWSHLHPTPAIFDHTRISTDAAWQTFSTMWFRLDFTHLLLSFNFECSHFVAHCILITVFYCRGVLLPSGVFNKCSLCKKDIWQE